ncbi:peptidase inhibitor family I36 protein [Streptomyces sp. NPDC087218]|uniref:peptidase inhibitor family I36 protein n=1 Tax=Streptomyces sp. NPDC087218 TaxID=3365769 RepID=UPI003809D15A
MRMTRKFAAVASGIALTGGLLVTSAGTVGATEVTPTAASDCPLGWYCVWSGENYTGRMQKVEGNNADLTRFVVFQGFKSRYQHGRNCDFKWYSGTNYTSSSGIIKRGSKLTGSTTHFIKSNKWVNCV